MAPKSNRELIPIYTDWANRHLTRCSAKPIEDLTNDLRDPRVLVTLLQTVTCDCVPGANDKLRAAIAGKADPTSIVDACLKFLISIGVSVSNVATSDILGGQLGAVLSLLYALSTFKQQLKQNARAAAGSSSPLKLATDSKPTSSFKAKVQKAKLPSFDPPTMPPNSKLPSPSIRPSGSSHQLLHTTVPSKLTAPSRISSKDHVEEKPPSPAPHTKFVTPKSSLRPPTTRLQPPSTKTSNLNNNGPSRSSSRSSSLASTATYTSIPSVTSVPTTSAAQENAHPATASKMLKIKIFGSGKEKEKKPEVGDGKNVKSAAVGTKTSGLMKPKSSGLRAPARLLNSKYPSKPTSSATSQQTSPLPLRKSKTISHPVSSATGLKPPSGLPENLKEKRGSKNSEEDSAYAGFGSSSPISSTESSSMSLNSTSSKNSSLSGNQTKVKAPNTLKYPEVRVPSAGVPVHATSPQESKPVLAVKGISAPKTTRFAPPASKLSPPKSTSGSSLKQHSPGTEKSNIVADCDQSQNVINAVNVAAQIPTISNAALPTTKTNAAVQSPTVGVVSPMMNHRNLRAPNAQGNDAGNQSDASTTSGSRDSDNVSVIYNPADDSKRQSNVSLKGISDKKAPPVPVRTSSRLETTFDSNSCVTTTEHTANGESELEGIRPMEPIVPRVPPPYSAVVRDGKVCRQPTVIQRLKTGGNHYRLPESSTSEDSLDSVTAAIRCAAQGRTSGYLSEGESLLAANSNLPDLSMADVSNGYMSEGGITVYARKMQARFREGLEAVRDSMRHRQHDFNDSFEDSSSVSSGISENFDDISTDDLTASSLSDHPMAATAAYGKLGEYQHFGGRLQQKRSVSASQGANAVRLQQRRLHEQENIDQLLQKCRTSQRGIACSAQAVRYSEGSPRPQYHTLGSNGHQMPQLALSDDGETLCVRNGPARSSLRIPAKQDHQVQAGPGFTTMAGYHSLDRKAHLLNYYRPPDDNPYRLAALGNETSAATLAMVSPRRMPNGQHIPFAQQPLEYAPPNRHSVAGGPMSARKPPIENIYANFSHRDANLQLHKLSDDGTRTPQMKSSRYTESGYLSGTSKTSPSGSGEANGSQLSLASSSGSVYSSIEEKYEAEIRKLNREMESYRSTISSLTAKHDGYNHLIQMFDNKLQLMAKHVESLQNKSQLKKEEVVKLRSEIDHLRVMSINAGVNVPSVAIANGNKNSSSLQSQEGAGELLRHPSLESVTSHRSSMSSSSKGSKTDKSSLNSFGKQGKKSWIRSSFSRAFSKGKKGKNGSVSDAEHSPMHSSGSPSGLKPISGSANRLDELESVPQVVELKKQLEDKDSALTDVRLDALDKAREVDILKETINRLKSENKFLKQKNNILEGKLRAESRTSSQQSLSVLPDEDPVYEVPPASECSFSASNSKRASACIMVKVTVSVDFSGELRPAAPVNEISIGGVPLPNHETSWQELDNSLYRLFKEYISRVDPNGALGLHCKESVIGYEFGEFVRDTESNSAPSPLPADVINQSSSIRISLRGANQRGLDGLILDCLFPRSMLDQLLKVLLQSRRLVLFGATGIGKSNLARQLARYLSIRIGVTPQDAVVDIKLSDDEHDKNMTQAQKQLDSLLRSTKPTVILIDNIQRHRIAFLSSTFSNVETPAKDGPYVICTVNRASQLTEMQVHHNFRMFLLPNNMEAIRGYMGRFLRRRILENEFRDDERASPEIYRIIEFLPKVLSAVNSFIEKSNSRDVTIGPRLFLQCPLDVEQSREWFIKLWNQMIIPYMIKVAKEGVKVLGRCGSFEDPTDLVCEHWPWIEGPAAEQVLQRLSIKESISNQPNPTKFDPLEALMRIQANNATPQQEVV